VQFSADGSTGFIITEQGISVVDLTAPLAPAIVPSVSFFNDPLGEKQPTDVTITADGARALMRQPGLAGIRVVDLHSGAIADVALGAEATDLDITPDGKLALVVLRDAGQLALIDLPGDLDDPTQIETLSTGYTIGQAVVTADNSRALLFTNALDQEVLLVADLRPGSRSLKPLPLKKGVRSVRPAGDGRTAIVLHNKQAGDPDPTRDPVDAFVDKHYAYSLVDLNKGFVKLELTDAEPGETAFATDSLSGYLLLSDPAKNVRSVEAIDLRTFLVTSVPVGSPPVAVGVLPATAQVYVAQNHPLGRVTFVDSITYNTRTLTGFALNGQVIE